jgi:Na+-transporting NADH:ubiquinone oxidoreductase subunit C
MVNKDSPVKALLVVFLTALICSSFVSAAVVLLRPVQLNNQLLERSRNIMQLTGLLAAGQELDDGEILRLYKSLDRRIVDIDQAVFDETIDPIAFDKRRAVNDPDLGVAVPAALDLANLGRRSRFAPVYLVWNKGEMERVILPVRGAGMWSTLYGFIALESDLNTIAGMTFYEQNETPGLGDQITHGHWLEQWKGRRIYDAQGNPRFRVSEGMVEAGSAMAGFQVDALTGATVTASAVTSLVHYWFGPHGYQGFLEHLHEQPPGRPPEDSG